MATGLFWAGLCVALGLTKPVGTQCTLDPASELVGQIRSRIGVLVETPLRQSVATGTVQPELSLDDVQVLLYVLAPRMHRRTVEEHQRLVRHIVRLMLEGILGSGRGANASDSPHKPLAG